MTKMRRQIRWDIVMLLLRTAARQSVAKKTGDCDVAAVAVDEAGVQ
jgi:hypothetical protein